MKTTKHKRDYMKAYQATPENVEKRVDRNRARRHAIADGKAHVGDGKDVDHKVPLRRGGSDSDKNTRVISKAENRGWRRGQSGYK